MVAISKTCVRILTRNHDDVWVEYHLWKKKLATEIDVDHSIFVQLGADSLI